MKGVINSLEEGFKEDARIPVRKIYHLNPRILDPWGSRDLSSDKNR